MVHLASLPPLVNSSELEITSANVTAVSQQQSVSQPASSSLTGYTDMNKVTVADNWKQKKNAENGAQRCSESFMKVPTVGRGRLSPWWAFVWPDSWTKCLRYLAAPAALRGEMIDGTGDALLAPCTTCWSKGGPSCIHCRREKLGKYQHVTSVIIMWSCSNFIPLLSCGQHEYILNFYLIKISVYLYFELFKFFRFDMQHKTQYCITNLGVALLSLKTPEIKFCHLRMGSYKKKKKK